MRPRPLITMMRSRGLTTLAKLAVRMSLLDRYDGAESSPDTAAKARCFAVAILSWSTMKHRAVALLPACRRIELMIAGNCSQRACSFLPTRSATATMGG